MSHYKRDWDGSACRSVLALGFIRQECFHLRPVGHPFVDTSNKGMWLTSTQESVNLATIVMWHSNHFQPWLTDFHHSAAYRIEPEATMNKEKRSRVGVFCVFCLELMKWRWPWENILMTQSGFVTFCFFVGPVGEGEACTQKLNVWMHFWDQILQTLMATDLNETWQNSSETIRRIIFILQCSHTF